MSELGNEVAVEDKGKKKRVSTEDKLQILLDKQFERIEQMVDDKFRKMDGIFDGKLDHTQFRMYNSVKAELRRWYTGYYNSFQ